MDPRLNLYGEDGWNVERRGWTETYSSQSLPELISSWTEMPLDDAERLVAETLEEWRITPAYAFDRQTGRWAVWAVLGVAAFALAFLGLLAWAIVSAVS